MQRQTFRFFWEAGAPRERAGARPASRGQGQSSDLVATGGSGFGVMALIVAVERGWVTREQALERLRAMLDSWSRATCYHGVFPHFIDGRTGATIPFSRKDDGGDLVETSFLCMGLLMRAAVFRPRHAAGAQLRDAITGLWEEVEWDWYTRGRPRLLYWHWSPNNGWAMTTRSTAGTNA